MKSSKADLDFVPMTVALDELVLDRIIRRTVRRMHEELDWPAERHALTESEAAKSCGVGRHVLRDLRLKGTIPTRKLGKAVVYTHADLRSLLDAGYIASDARSRDATT